uniref:RWD domain-containing protein n=1 Tax=Triticum urartu TaxID=4572 RepID=A0A8R7PSI4_TRIUA
MPPVMADYEQEQEMELEALQAILMDDIKEIDPSESGIDTNSRCFEILLSPQDDDFDEAAHVPGKLILYTILLFLGKQISLHTFRNAGLMSLCYLGLICSSNGSGFCTH